MSKAFPREDDRGPEVVVPPRRRSPPPLTPPIEQLRDEGKARLGARVKIRGGDGHEAEYRLVTAEEGDPAHRALSVISPLRRFPPGQTPRGAGRVQRPRGV